MPLTIACDKGHHETVEVLVKHLLERKVDVNAKDKVSQGVGCESAPIGARPRIVCQGLGSGFCYGLMMMCERVGQGLR